MNILKNKTSTALTVFASVSILSITGCAPDIPDTKLIEAKTKWEEEFPNVSDFYVESFSESGGLVTALRVAIIYDDVSKYSADDITDFIDLYSEDFTYERDYSASLTLWVEAPNTENSYNIFQDVDHPGEEIVVDGYTLFDRRYWNDLDDASGDGKGIWSEINMKEKGTPDCVEYGGEGVWLSSYDKTLDLESVGTLSCYFYTTGTSPDAEPVKRKIKVLSWSEAAEAIPVK